LYFFANNKKGKMRIEIKKKTLKEKKEEEERELFR